MPSAPPSEEDRNPSEEEDEYDDEEEDEEEEEEEPAPPPQLPQQQQQQQQLNSFSSSSSSDDSHFHKPSSSPLLLENGPSFKRPAGESSPENKRLRITDHEEATPALPSTEPEKKVLDDSRKLFQRLWTDEDEIGLLKGFLEYSRKGTSNFHDMTPFYDQIKTSFNLEFNKNQLVEKLRRLKKKYRNVVSKIGSGKEFSFKSPHDQETFEISRKIWSGVKQEPVEEYEEGNADNCDNNNNNNCVIERKTPKIVKRSRKVNVASDPKVTVVSDPVTGNHQQPSSSTANVMEDTVKSCLSPVFKELLQCVMNGGNGSGYGIAMNALPLSFGNPPNTVNLLKSADEKWRKQQILELEVYSKRLELVQEQIKCSLEELKSMGT